MPKNDVLYCKGMNVSESDGDGQSCDDKWDDTQLNAAYDKALKLANVEVAKRIAMSTNSKHDNKEQKKPKQNSKKSNKKKWSSGMPCRAVYEGDGLEYEAFVLQILNDKECIVKFLGYGNAETVDMDTMKPSEGRDAQQRQIEMAMIEKGEESDASVPLVTDADARSDRAQSQSPGSTVRSFKKESRKKKRNPQPTTCFQLPEMPMPNLDKLRNMASMDIPMPPPLPFPCASGVQCEEQAVSSMLISWYMSGYYTGLYQGLKRSKLNKRQKD